MQRRTVSSATAGPPRQGCCGIQLTPQEIIPDLAQNEEGTRASCLQLSAPASLSLFFFAILGLSIPPALGRSHSHPLCLCLSLLSTSSPILSLLPLVPSWPLLSGGYNVGPLTHPIEFLLWECFSVRSVSFRGPPSLLHIPHHTRLPGQTSSSLGEAGHECKHVCVRAMVQTGGGP